MPLTSRRATARPSRAAGRVAIRVAAVALAALVVPVALVGCGGDSDPAPRAGGPTDIVLATTTDAFRSRGDGSGSAVLERSLWKAAAVRPTKPWYVATHAVMPPTLMRASTDEAYALTDRATFLRLQKQLKLRVIAQGGDRLADPYSVIVVAHPDARTACARKLADYLDSPGSQAIINSFGVTQWGQALYAGAAPTP